MTLFQILAAFLNQSTVVKFKMTTVVRYLDSGTPVQKEREAALLLKDG